MFLLFVARYLFFFKRLEYLVFVVFGCTFGFVKCVMSIFCKDHYYFSVVVYPNTEQVFHCFHNLYRKLHDHSGAVAEFAARVTK